MNVKKNKKEGGKRRREGKREREHDESPIKYFMNL
jgi:hypothetical protein